MARNYIQPGDTMSFTAPYDVAAGGGMKVGQLFAVAQDAALNGETVQGMIVGVHELAKADAQEWTEHALVYWNDTTKVCTTVATGNLLIGSAAEPVANTPGLVTGKVRLNGIARADGA